MEEEASLTSRSQTLDFITWFFSFWNDRKWAKMSEIEQQRGWKKREEKKRIGPQRTTQPETVTSATDSGERCWVWHRSIRLQLPDNKSMALSLFRWIWQGEAIGHSAIPLRWLRGSTASSLLVATVFFPNFLLAPLIFGSGAGLRRLQRQ